MCMPVPRLSNVSSCRRAPVVARLTVRSLRAAALAMTTRVVERKDWGGELDRFSRQHEGWIVSVRTQPADGATAVAAPDVPLRGVSRASPESDDITIAVGDGRDHLTHEIHCAVALQID